MKNTLLLFLTFSIFTSSGQYSNGMRIKMEGYIINLNEGKIIFQPCHNSNTSFWNSFANNAFELNFFEEELYRQAIDKIGDSLRVKLIYSADSLEYYMRLRFFYCEIEMDMIISEKNTFRIYSQPRYFIIHNDKRLPLESFFVDNRVLKIIPKNKKNLSAMYNFYKNSGYSIPDYFKK